MKSKQSFSRTVCGKIHLYRSGVTVLSSSIHIAGECFQKNDMAQREQLAQSIGRLLHDMFCAGRDERLII